MHEAREAAAQVAWKYCLAHPVLDLETIRELIRVVEPVLAAGWYATLEKDAIVHPDQWPDAPPAPDAESADFPTVREVNLD